MPILRGLIAAGVRNPVFVNLLMVCLLAGGLVSALSMVRESYPESSLDHIAIEMVYPGASPEDVEQAICTPIEEALRGLRGVRKISSSANENFGAVWVGLLSSVKDPLVTLNEVKDRVDQITDFPPEAEEPVVRETFIRAEVINVAIYGDAPEPTLKAFGEEVRNDLAAMPGISQISLSGIRDEEILIEVTEQALAAYGLSLEQIMAVVARSSLDLPAGVIRTRGEEVTLRVTGQRLLAAEYEQLVVLERGDTIVRLGDIATVREGFEDAVVQGQFNGKPAVVVQVYKTPLEDATQIAAMVRDYVQARQAGLPDRLHMNVWADGSRDINGRIALLVSNGFAGIVLVFLTLWLFLDARVSFWVAAGIPISFAGALIITYSLGGTINMVSLFGLIIVSGIIVDDAIVIADSVHSRRRAGEAPALASINGTVEVGLPVLGASITTIATFAPLLFVTGVMGKFIYILPVVVIAAICASAVEAFLVLPSHLCHLEPPGVVREHKPYRARKRLDRAFDRFVTRYYRPLFRSALRAPFVTVSIALALMLIIVGMVLGGRTPLVLYPQEDGNILRTRIRFPEGTPSAVTQRAIQRIEQAAMALNRDADLLPATTGPLVRQVYSILGEFADFLPVRGNNIGETRIELMPAEERGVSDERIMDAWADKIGKIHDVNEFRMERQQLGPMDRPIEIRLLGLDLEAMSEASRRIQHRLLEFEGMNNVTDDLLPGKREMRIRLRPSARALGLTLDDVARQLRHGFFGGEALRVRRGRNEVKVRVRFPEEQRRSIVDLEHVRITTPQGLEIPFLEVADISWGQSYANIMHQDGKRRVRVVADVDDRVANAEQIMQTLQAGFLDEVVSEYNELTWEFGGDRERLKESLSSLWKGFALALIANYTILGAMLRSYVQPIVIMLAVPFGLVGAVVGHNLLGLDLTLLSLFGVVALSGIVVNDSLVLIDVINAGIREGKSVKQSVEQAGERRFRAVVLTSVTTIAGLAPLLLERSVQAQTLIPMAVSLTFGLAFATLLTLFVVPALYLIINDARRLVRWLRYGGEYPAPELVEEAADDRWLAVT